MVTANYQRLVFNLGLPCVGAVIYDEIFEDITHYFSNTAHPQGHYKIAAL